MKRTTLLSALAAALVSTTTAWGAPLSTPFLSVDINGGQGANGVTEDDPSRWQGWDINDGSFISGIINDATQAFGPYTATVPFIGAGISARDRGNGNPAEGVPNNNMLQDFVFSSRDTAGGFGRHYVALTVDGLTPGTNYEVTLHHYDPFAAPSGPNFETEGFLSYQATGLVNPADYLDANVGAGASYQPAAGGANNPIPTTDRAPSGGPWPSDPVIGIPFEEAEYFYSTTVVAPADGGGSLTVYSWADLETFTNASDITKLNGFEIGVAIPEPTTVALMGLALAGLGVARRR